MARLTSALVLAALLHAAGRASARETATTTNTASAACQTGIQQILKPAATANLTQKYPTRKVPLRYCSAQYFETLSVNITVYIAPASSTNPVQDGVIVGQKNASGTSAEYDITLKIPKSPKPAASSQLFVLEWFLDIFDGDIYRTTYISEPVNF